MEEFGKHMKKFYIISCKDKHRRALYVWEGVYTVAAKAKSVIKNTDNDFWVVNTAQIHKIVRK